jgi:pimeloyl-ACP methyl ester carboxylesterase
LNLRSPVAIAITVAVLITTLAASFTAADERVVGIWQGTLQVQGFSLRIVFTVTRGDDGELTAKLDSPDQGAMGIPVDAVEVNGDAVRFEVAIVAGFFEGVLAEDGKAIAGEWQQSGMTIPITLERSDKIPTTRRPQDPEPPFPYGVEDVRCANETAGVTIAGTLTLPRTEGPHPATLLISGSGPQNRDEELMGHRPFLVLADHLTRQGIAVLRVDDRGTGESTGDYATATSQDFATDVMACVRYLMSRSDIDSRKVGLIGHSEGGLIAPMVAAQSNDIAFVVLMAGPGQTGEEILIAQGDLLAQASGAPPAAIELNRELSRQIFAIVKAEPDDGVASEQLRAVLKETMPQLMPGQTEPTIDAAIEGQLRSVLSPWFRFFLTYDPKPTLSKVRCPVLAINGELDLQVPPVENLSAIDAALQAGGNTDYTTREVMGVNHLFQTATTGTIAEYGTIDETISPHVLETISSWVVARVR